jgi:hypothetical protein
MPHSPTYLDRYPAFISMSSTSPPSIVFWNCNGLRRHLTSGVIQALVNPAFTPHPPSILVLSETHWSPSLPSRPNSPNKLPTIPGHSWTYRHHTHKSGGLAILHHNSIAFLPMPALDQQCFPLSTNPKSPALILWHTVCFPNTPAFLLGSCYIPPPRP